MERPATKIVNTTLGELIAAASEVAFEYSDNDKDAYRMARLALIEILKNSPNPMILDEDFDLEPVGKKHYH
ncbi:MAG TPA: hypothetical protein VLX11_04745 [Candidatus Acidoferrales bacterium]|nr:hypothetical protein [Candidatus Acidoferrales bacterium]